MSVLTYRGGWPVGLIGARLRSGEAVPDWLNGQGNDRFGIEHFGFAAQGVR